MTHFSRNHMTLIKKKRKRMKLTSEKKNIQWYSSIQIQDLCKYCRSTGLPMSFTRRTTGSDCDVPKWLEAVIMIRYVVFSSNMLRGMVILSASWI